MCVLGDFKNQMKCTKRISRLRTIRGAHREPIALSVHSYAAVWVNKRLPVVCCTGAAWATCEVKDASLFVQPRPEVRGSETASDTISTCNWISEHKVDNYFTSLYNWRTTAHPMSRGLLTYLRYQHKEHSNSKQQFVDRKVLSRWVNSSNLHHCSWVWDDC